MRLGRVKDVVGFSRGSVVNGESRTYTACGLPRTKPQSHKVSRLTMWLILCAFVPSCETINEVRPCYQQCGYAMRTLTQSRNGSGFQRGWGFVDK